MLRLENPDNVCYANAGTNALLSSPFVTRFLFSLPNNNVQLNTVRKLARNQPNQITNLTELRGIVAQNTNKDFNQDNRQQDVCEWIEDLQNTIETKLKGDLQKDFSDFFQMESTITFKCYQNHKSQIKEVNQMLRLPLMDEKENHLNSIDAILQDYFQEQRIERNCHTCDSVSALKSQKITTYPQVLVLQYKRFTREEYKIADQIICGTSLKLGNASYKLTGIVVHVGSSMRVGHYYAITCCWETGKAYKLNDAQVPKTLQEMN